VGLVPRPDTLPVLALGLGEQWEQQPDGGLWLRDGVMEGQLRPAGLEEKPPFRPAKLTPQQRDDALAQLRAGSSPQQVADALGVSYWVILRLIKRHDPAKLPAQQQPKLTPEQQVEARRMLAEGMTLRQVGRHFGVSYGAIWRLTHRDEANDTHKTRNEGR
jgi:transposase